MEFDTEIHQRVKADNFWYEGYKPNPQDWVGVLEEYPEFAEDFKRVFNNADIPKGDDFTPEAIEKTYVDMEIVLPRDEEDP